MATRNIHKLLKVGSPMSYEDICRDEFANQVKANIPISVMINYVIATECHYYITDTLLLIKKDQTSPGLKELKKIVDDHEKIQKSSTKINKLTDLDIDELVQQVCVNDKKKKRRTKKKKENILKETIEDNNEVSNKEDNLIIEEFKITIYKDSKNSFLCNKIKPIISPDWITNMVKF
jgi:hypothetical protein